MRSSIVWFMHAWHACMRTLLLRSSARRCVWLLFTACMRVIACRQGADRTQVINGAAKTWGLECLRYEIKDILPPPGIVKAMELQAEAERRKRAQVLESEGVRQATINESEAKRVRSRPVCTCTLCAYAPGLRPHMPFQSGECALVPQELQPQM